MVVKFITFLNSCNNRSSISCYIVQTFGFNTPFKNERSTCTYVKTFSQFIKVIVACQRSRIRNRHQFGCLSKCVIVRYGYSFDYTSYFLICQEVIDCSCIRAIARKRDTLCETLSKLTVIFGEYPCIVFVDISVLIGNAGVGLFKIIVVVILDYIYRLERFSADIYCLRLALIDIESILVIIVVGFIVIRIFVIRLGLIRRISLGL